MVKVFFGEDESAVIGIDIFFHNVYRPEWFSDERVKQIVRDIDDSEVINENLVMSPILGGISVDEISGGAKACICMLKMEDTLIDLIVCGPNCQEWLSRIWEEKDVEVTMGGCHLTFKDLPVHGICLNDESTINDYKDWVTKMGEFAEDER